MTLLVCSCKPTTVAPNARGRTDADLAHASPTANVDANAKNDNAPFAHGVTVYVSVLNCEMNAADATQLNQLASNKGIRVEVVFVGITSADSAVVQQARKDLGLTVSSRVVRDGELARYKSIGISRMPMALVIKGKQLSTIVSGATMPKTLGLIDAAFSSGAAR